MTAEAVELAKATARRRRRRRRLLDVSWSYAFLLPGLVVFLGFLGLPLLLAIRRSLETGRPGFTQFAGLDNYVAVVSSPTFWLAVRNTAVYTIVTVGLGMVISLGLAVMIFPYSPRVQAFFKAAFYLPTVVSAVVVTMIWAWLYNPPYGVLNWLLSLFDLPPVAWLGTSTTAMPALMAMSLATSRGVGVILITASMASIPGEIYDAASIDGAGRWTLFRRITFPLIRPVVLYLLLISTIEASQVFTPMWVLTHGGPQNTTTSVAFLIYRTGFLSFDLGTAAAQSMLLLAILLPVSLIYFRVLGRDVEF